MIATTSIDHKTSENQRLPLYAQIARGYQRTFLRGAVVLLALGGFATASFAEDREADQAAVKAIAMELGVDSDKVSYKDSNRNGRYDDGELLELDVDCSEEFLKAVRAAATKHPELAVKMGEALVYFGSNTDEECLAKLGSELVQGACGPSEVDGKSVTEGKSVVVLPNQILEAMSAAMEDSTEFMDNILFLLPTALLPQTDSNLGNNTPNINPPSPETPPNPGNPGVRPPDGGQVTPVTNP